jgi:hypothetical protein
VTPLVRLVACKTVSEVIATVNQYIDVSAQVLSRVPESCRPSMVKDAEDVFQAATALELYAEQLKRSNREVGHELDVTAIFFTAAAKKIKRLR